MRILAFMLMYVFDSVGAAFEGDYSGINSIGNALISIGLFFIFGCLLIGFSTEGSGTIFLIALAMTIVGGFMAVKSK